MDQLQELCEDLWSRWRGAFGGFTDLAQSAGSGERVVYADARLFDLRKYTPRRFLAGGHILPTLPEAANSYHMYQLDSMGRPINMACRHVVNNFDWQGFYRYSTNEVEYVEFCLQTEVVSDYSRMVLRDGLPATFQHIRINGGGSHLGNHTGKEAIDYIRQDSYRYWTLVEEYETLDGRIVSGKALAEGATLSPRRSSLEYSYSDVGKLEQIVRIHDNGVRATEFAARSKYGMSELGARLSKAIAARTLEALRKADFGAPLLAVELSYRSVNYLPILIPATERDSIPNLVLPTVIDPENWIMLNAEDFEPEMTDFVERLSTTGRWELGPKMLRQAARVVTHQGPDSFTAADCFVAYAIDWEYEGHELPTILKQCGASAATLKTLKSIGWLE